MDSTCNLQSGNCIIVSQRFGNTISDNYWANFVKTELSIIFRFTANLQSRIKPNCQIDTPGYSIAVPGYFFLVIHHR